MFEFLFGKKESVQKNTEEQQKNIEESKKDKEEQLEIPVMNITKYNKNTKKNKMSKFFMYLVMKKTTGEVLGIYNNLDLAKKKGQESTYYNCAIYKYKINDVPRYLNNPIYED
jgi:hypothetical protein